MEEKQDNDIDMEHKQCTTVDTNHSSSNISVSNSCNCNNCDSTIKMLNKRLNLMTNLVMKLGMMNVDYSNLKFRSQTIKELKTWYNYICITSKKYSFQASNQDEHVKYEQNIENFLNVNGEQCFDPHIYIKHYKWLNINNVVSISTVTDCHVTQLNGQYGVYALMDIPRGTVISQYCGAELSPDESHQLIDNTLEEINHRQYSLDIEFDEEILKLLKKKNELLYNKVFHDWENPGLIIDVYSLGQGNLSQLPNYSHLAAACINDPRQNIKLPDTTTTDKQMVNCVFVPGTVNNWPSSFVVTIKNIHKGEQLWIDYGDRYHLLYQLIDEQQQKRDYFESLIKKIGTTM